MSGKRLSRTRSPYEQFLAEHGISRTLGLSPFERLLAERADFERQLARGERGLKHCASDLDRRRSEDRIARLLLAEAAVVERLADAEPLEERPSCRRCGTPLPDTDTAYRYAGKCPPCASPNPNPQTRKA